MVGATAKLVFGGNFVMKKIATLRASGFSNSAVLNIYFSGTGVSSIYERSCYRSSESVWSGSGRFYRAFECGC